MEHTKQSAIDRIETNPNILLGKPVIKGTRISVSLILNLLAHGYTPERVVEAYPQLTVEDVRAAIWRIWPRARFSIFFSPHVLGIIVLRIENQTVESANATLKRLLDEKIFDEEDNRKALIIIDEKKIRVRK